MSWTAPTTGATGVGILVKQAGQTAGVTTLRWGTDGLLQSPKPADSFAVVTRFSQAPIVENIKLTNGNGLTTTEVDIVDGTTWNITVRDDNRIWNTSSGIRINSEITIVDMGGLISTPGLIYTARVKNPNYEAAPKQPGERVITAIRLTAIDTGSGT